VDDFERWANLEGPEPDEIRALLDAAEGPGTAAAREARMARRLQDAISADERRKNRPRTLVRWGAKTLAAVGIAAGIVLALRALWPGDPIASQPQPTDHRRAREIPTLDAGRAPPAPEP
jgi:hypothetical protein